eukprot:2098323-Rhodomonas_salina.1
MVVLHVRNWHRVAAGRLEGWRVSAEVVSSRLGQEFHGVSQSRGKVHVLISSWFQERVEPAR